jgi:hypothetical protein
MNHTQDVERLFSWLKAPMVHYREFAPQVEVAEAVAAWPVVHRAAVETGVVGQDEPAPHGSAAAHERIARERAQLPTTEVAAVTEIPAAGSSAAADAGGSQETDRAAHEGIIATLGDRLQTAHRERAEPEPVIGEGQADAAPPRVAQPAAPAPQRQAPSAVAPVREQGALFAGEYRGREREVRPSGPVADRQDRSLEAVFSRLSGGRDRLPDPRARGRTTPGLGGVFSRLR